MADVVVDVESWPLVRLRFPARPVSDAEFERCLDRLERLLSAETQHVLLVDALRVQQALSAAQLFRVSRWTSEHRARIVDRTVGTAIVLRAAAARGVLTAYFWMTGRPLQPHGVFESLEEGERWCRERLARAGVRVGGGSRSSAPPPPPEADDARLGPPPRTRALHVVATFAPVVDMFREAAFIVDIFGAVLHANDAARRAYPDAPSWLGSVMSDGPRSATPECRILSLDDGHAVFLVIPCASLHPDDVVSPAVSLPPSLERIAHLLARGLTDKDIANELEIPLATVRTYVTRIYRKLGISSRSHLIRMFGRPEGGD